MTTTQTTEISPIQHAAYRSDQKAQLLAHCIERLIAAGADMPAEILEAFADWHQADSRLCELTGIDRRGLAEIMATQNPTR